MSVVQTWRMCGEPALTTYRITTARRCLNAPPQIKPPALPLEAYFVDNALVRPGYRMHAQASPPALDVRELVVRSQWADTDQVRPWKERIQDETIFCDYPRIASER